MTKEIAYIGIDPGAQGSFCLLVPATKEIEFYSTNDKPSNAFNWLNLQGQEYNIRIIMIEDVHSIHGTSAKSNFNFGYNVGVVNALSSATGMGVDKIQPRAWQVKVGVKVPKGITGNARKKLLKKNTGHLCDQLYPLAEIRGPKGGLLDGRSDSLMIAHAAFLIYNQVT